MLRQVCRPTPPVYYNILATPDETSLAVTWHLPHPAPYTVIVDRSWERKRQLSTSSQFHSPLAPYMVMVDRPLRRDSKISTVLQSCSVCSLNQMGCRAKWVADTQSDGVRVQVVTWHKHHWSSPWMKGCFRHAWMTAGFCVLMRLLFVPGCLQWPLKPDGIGVMATAVSFHGRVHMQNIIEGENNSAVHSTLEFSIIIEPDPLLCYTCRDKRFCPNKTFITASILLSQQKTCLLWQKLWQLPPMIRSSCHKASDPFHLLVREKRGTWGSSCVSLSESLSEDFNPDSLSVSLRVTLRRTSLPFSGTINWL